MDNVFYNLFNSIEDDYIMKHGIKTISNVFETASESDFNNYIHYLIDNNEKEKFELFIYYLLLFRENKHVQFLLNMKSTPIQLIEKLIIFSHGYIIYKGSSPDDIFDNLLLFLSNDKILELLLLSDVFLNDKLMLFFLLTKLDIQHIDEFFKKSKNIEKTIQSFMYLPEKAIYNILHKNIDLFDFILSILPVYINSTKVNSFYKKFAKEIDIIKNMNKLITKLKRNTKTEKDNKNKKEIDLSRITTIISMIDSNNISVESLNMFSKSDIFISKFEELLFYEIISNDIYRQTLQKLKETKYFEIEEAIIF